MTRGGQPRSTIQTMTSPPDITGQQHGSSYAVGATGPEHAGVASGILNAARQSGGALGVALLGSLLGSGHALNLHVPLLVATAGYLIAVVLAWVAIRGGERTPSSG